MSLITSSILTMTGFFATAWITQVDISLYQVVCPARLVMEVAWKF